MKKLAFAFAAALALLFSSADAFAHNDLVHAHVLPFEGDPNRFWVVRVNARTGEIHVMICNASTDNCSQLNAGNPGPWHPAPN